MDISNLMALVNAGFTKDEIFSLIVPEQKAPEQKAPEQKAPEQKAPEQKAPEQKAPEQKAPEQDAIKTLDAKVDYLLNRLNLIAVQGSRQPDTIAESVDDILAKMI